jgi:hypothetical protein
MFYVVKSVSGRYMNTGGQYVNQSGRMERTPAWVGSKWDAWCSSSVDSAQAVVDFLKDEIGIESTVEELT